MRKILIILAIFFLAIATIFLLGSAEAKTVIVDDDWPGADYNSISAAIASVRDGDTIRVYDGVYAGSVEVDKTVDLVGNGTSTTIIDGYGVNGKGRLDHQFAFSLSAGGCNVSGFQFRNCNPTHEYGPIGVYSSDNRIFDNLFLNNLNGIYLVAGNNIIFNNSFDTNYYGIRSDSNANGCVLSFNYFTQSTIGAVLYSKASDVTFFSNVFEDQPRNGLTFYEVDDVTVAYNMFKSNSYSSTYRRALMVYKCEGADIHNNTFVSNTKDIYITQTNDVKLYHNTIRDNLIGISMPKTHANVIARYNNIYNNTLEGVEVYDFLGNRSDMAQNWWGDLTGPYHHANNTGGKGNNVTDNVDFDHWLGQFVDLDPIAFINYVEPTLANEGDPIEFRGRGLARNWTELHLWTSSIDGEIYSGTDVVFTLSGLSPGTHTITLKVRDDYGKWSDGVSTTLVINGIPQAFIVGIVPAVVNEGDEITFKGRYVDHEDDVRYIIWESDINGVIGHDIEFTRTDLSNGTHRISLTVVDGYSVRSNTAIGEVIVNGIPRAIIEAIEPGMVNDSEPVIFRGGFIDHEDSVIWFHWESDIDGVLSDQARFYSSSLSNGTHTITYRVMDDFEAWSENVTATLVVNGVPKAIIESISPALATSGEDVTFNGAFIDHEKRVVAYEWLSDIDGTLNSRKEFTTSALSPGTHLISFRVMDHTKVWSQWAVSTVHVNGRPSSWIEPGDPVLLNEGETLHLTGGFEDLEDDIRGYEWRSDIDGTVGTSWDLTTSDLSNGTHSISYRVMDGKGAWSKAMSVQVTVNGIPRVAIFGIDPVSAQEGEAIEFRGAYHDHEDVVYILEWASDKDGPLSSELEFATSGLSNGTHVITFWIMDGHGATSELAFGKVVVNGVPRVQITNVGPQGVMEGENVHFSGKASDDVAVLAYSWSSSIDGQLSDLRVFSTSDLSPGTHTITFTAQDDQGTWSDESTVTFEVEGYDFRAEIIGVDLPASALEGNLVTVGCVVGNPGNIPLLDLTVRFSFDGQVIGEIEEVGPIHPDAEITVDVLWTVVVGTHAVLVEVILDGVVITSALSDGTIDVDPVPVIVDDPPVTPTPNDGSDGGIDRIGMVLLLSALVAVTGIAFMLRSRERDDGDTVEE